MPSIASRTRAEAKVRRPFAIRTRLTLWYGAVLGTTVVVLGMLIWLSTSAVLRGSVDEALRVQAADVRAGMDRGFKVAVTSLDPAQPGIFTAIFGPRGTLTSHSPNVPVGLRPPLGATTIEEELGSASFAVLGAPAPDGQTIVVGSSLVAVYRTLDSLALLLVGIGLAGFAGSLVGGWLLSGRALGPVEQLRRETTMIGAGDLERRLPEPVRLDEIGRLTITLNGMLDRVAASVGRERAFIAAASHDLRTPISALRTELELAARDPGNAPGLLAAVQVAHADAVRLSTLAADLLELAAAEAGGRAVVRRAVAVSEIVAAATAAVQPLTSERGTSIAVMSTDKVVNVDRVRLEQALVNLLSNAIRESSEQSTIDVIADLVHDESPDADAEGHPAGAIPGPGWRSGHLEIAVHDRGPGVAASVRPVLFIPFAARARSRSDGTGLGLATAAAAARAHGGRIDYEDRPGGGATFRIRIPTAVLLDRSPSATSPRPLSSAPAR